MEKEMQHFEDYCASTISKGPSRMIKHCGYVVHDITEARWPGQGGGSGSRNPNSENMNGEECNISIHNTSFDNCCEENSRIIFDNVFATVPRRLLREGLEEFDLATSFKIDEMTGELNMATAGTGWDPLLYDPLPRISFEDDLGLRVWASMPSFSPTFPAPDPGLFGRAIASLEEEGVAPLEEEGREASLEEKWKALLMSAVALLSLAYQCLTGYIDGVGTKLYSSSSLGFRPANDLATIRIFVSHASGYRRNSKSKSSETTKHFATRLEVRYKPPRRSGNTNYIHLCMCDTDEEARIYKKIASHYYSEQNDGKLDFGNGDYFVIPSMPIELEQVLSVSGKRAWVRDKVKEVYKDFLKAKDARSQPDIANNTDCAGDHDLAVNLISALLSGGPSVALDHGFGVEEVEMMNLPPVHEDSADPFGISLDDYLYIPKGEFEMFDVLPQHFHVNNARESRSAAAPMVDDLHPPDTASVEIPSASSLSEGIPPSVPNFGPTIPTRGPVILVQHVQERDEKIEEQKQQIEEQKQQIEEQKQQIEEQKQLINFLV